MVAKAEGQWHSWLLSRQRYLFRDRSRYWSKPPLEFHTVFDVRNLLYYQVGYSVDTIPAACDWRTYRLTDTITVSLSCAAMGFPEKKNEFFAWNGMYAVFWWILNGIFFFKIEVHINLHQHPITPNSGDSSPVPPWFMPMHPSGRGDSFHTQRSYTQRPTLLCLLSSQHFRPGYSHTDRADSWMRVALYRLITVLYYVTIIYYY